MKRFCRFLLPALVLLSVEAKSQAYTYHPFPDSGIVWHGKTACLGGSSPWEYSIGTDTTVNNRLYRAIASQNFNLGWVSVDSAKKVYFFKNPGNGDTGTYQGLLYDFSLSVGDTINAYHHTLTVHAVDTPVYFGVARRTIHLKVGTVYDHDIWIEGIGSFIGPFATWPTFSGMCAYSVLCFALQDSVLLYQRLGTTGSCSYLDITENAFADKDILLSPNPVTTSFTLQLSSSPITETHLLLYDALGREVKRELITAQTTKVNRNNLTTGIYYWQLQSGSAPVGRGKLVFE